MTKTTRLIALFSLLLTSQLVRAQDDHRHSIVSKALLSVFEGTDEIRSDDRSLDDVASAVSAVLSGVDRDRLNGLQSKLDDLQNEEKSLQRMLKELDQGLPLPISVTEELDATAAPATQESVQSEKEVLLGLKAELARRERQRAERRALAERLEDAQKPTRSTRALLTALGELPEAVEETELPDTTPVASTPFPKKLADALYRTGDYRGALRLYQRAEGEDQSAIESKDRYRMARCQEWLGKSETATETLEKLIADQPDESDFWHQRAKSYLGYIKNAPKLERVLKQS